MKKGITLFMATFAISAITYGFYKMAIGNYFDHNLFNGILILSGLVLVTYGVIKLSKDVFTGNLIWLILLTLPLLKSCNYAKSNQQVVVSTDCGMTWEKINAGESVPRGGVNACYMKVVIPNFPMQGESKFVSNLKDRVRASVHIDYDYSIVDPLSFIKQAKYLGKANSNADDVDALDPNAFEGAENMVIDKRIKDVSKTLFITEDIVELDQSELENKLLLESNKILEPLGVHLNFITLTFDLDEQTRQAIDVSTAMKIYQSKNLTDVGRIVIQNKAGATKIEVVNQVYKKEGE